MGVGSFRSSGDDRSFLDVVSQCSRRGADRSFIVGPKEEFAPSRGAGRCSSPLETFPCRIWYVVIQLLNVLCYEA